MRVITIGLLVGLVGLGLSACGDDGVEPRLPGTLESAGPTNLTGHAGGTATDSARVRVLDRNDAPLPGTEVFYRWETDPATVIDVRAVTDSRGEAAADVRLPTMVGEGVYRAEIRAFPDDPILFQVTITEADSLRITAHGNSEGGRVGDPLDKTFTVRVTDIHGNPIDGAEVEFAVTGDGSVDPLLDVTNDLGQASTVWTLGPVPGVQSLTVTAGGASLKYPITVREGLPARVTVLSGDLQAVQTRQRAAHELEVLIEDRLGNPVPGESVGFAIVQGGGDFAGKVGWRTDDNGIVSTPFRAGSTPERTVIKVGTQNGSPEMATFHVRTYEPVPFESVETQLRSVTLHWDNRNPGVTRVDVFRGLVGHSSPWETLAAFSDVAISSYADSTVVPGRSYHYGLELHFEEGNSARMAGSEVDAWVDLDLEGISLDMALDPVRDRLYVSIPSWRRVVVVSTQTLEVVETITFEVSPRGIDIDHTGSTLFVALDGIASVALINLDSFAREVVDVSSTLGTGRISDVLEVTPDRLLVSAQHGHVALVFLDQNNAVNQVADSRKFISHATLYSDPQGADAYVLSGVVTTSLCKLDMSRFNAPVLLEQTHTGTETYDRLAVSPDGARLVLGNGQILNTEDFSSVGELPPGTPLFNAAGTKVHMQRGAVITEYEWPSLLPGGTTGAESWINLTAWMENETGFWVILGTRFLRPLALALP